MAVSINWATQVISVPQADLTFISGTLYELDTDWFRLQLKDLEDSSDGMAFLRTHKHNTEVTILGTTFARVIEIINGYSITFEDLPYTVKLVGSNNNFFDVDGGILNRNQVQVVSTNSAGLIASVADREISQSINFKDGVYLDVNGSITGTAYPNGTRAHPVNNLTDALALCAMWSTSVINLAGTLTLDQSVSGLEFISWKNGEVDLNGQTAMASKFKDLKVYGTQVSIGLFYDCRIGNLQGMQGVYDDCKFVDATPLVLSGGQTTINNATSTIAGEDMATFDCSNDGLELEMRNGCLGLTLTNYAHASNSCVLGFNSGLLVIDSTCTAGTIYAGGIFALTDNGTATIDVTSKAAAEDKTLSKIEEMNLI